MELLHIIYHQFFFTVHCLKYQHLTSQFIQSSTPQPWPLAAKALEYILPEYAFEIRIIVIFTQSEY